MSTLRLPQFKIDSSGMRKSKSMDPLSFLKATIGSGSSSPLPDALQSFVSDFDTLQPRSKSAEPIVFSAGGKETQRQKEARMALEQLESGLLLTGMINSESIYSTGIWRPLENVDAGDYDDPKFNDLNQAHRSYSLDAMTEEDLLTKGLIVPSNAHRSCLSLEKSDKRSRILMNNMRRIGLKCE
uniref:Uncharacterized protein n=1 Tax=Plectus sambesii TaxID=2011161 RepID=A0A914XR72_9BILA